MAFIYDAQQEGRGRVGVFFPRLSFGRVCRRDVFYMILCVFVCVRDAIYVFKDKFVVIF